MASDKRIRWKDVDRSKTDIQFALESLEQAKALKSPRTLAWYRGNVRAIREWLIADGHSTVLADLTVEIVQSFIAAEANPAAPVAPATAAGVALLDVAMGSSPATPWAWVNATQKDGNHDVTENLAVDLAFSIALVTDIVGRPGTGRR
jgi:hypothetical protein